MSESCNHDFWFGVCVHCKQPRIPTPTKEAPNA